MPHALTIDIGLILLVASVVAIASRRLRLPYSVGLVSAGILLALVPAGIGMPLSPDEAFSLLLPPLIFEAALQIHWAPFRRELPVILTLASAGVLIAAAVVAAGMHLVAGWGWPGAAAFGALIAATDPVSVIAAFREVRVEPRLSLLVEGESLLNDGAAAVVFAVVVAVSTGASPEPAAMGALLLWKVVGGILLGGGLAGALLLLAGRTEDHLVEITLTTIGAYGAFLLAERLQTSGVMGSLTAGMVIGNIGRQGYVSPSGRSHVLYFWEYAAFLANSLVFILIGVNEARQAVALFTATAAAAVGLVLLSRVAAVYPLCALFRRSPLAVNLRWQHVLVWGGLRGALGLALALTLPESVPERREIIAAAFAVVAFSIFVQGLTMGQVLHRLGVIRPPARDGD